MLNANPTLARDVVYSDTITAKPHYIARSLRPWAGVQPTLYDDPAAYAAYVERRSVPQVRITSQFTRLEKHPETMRQDGSSVDTMTFLRKDYRVKRQIEESQRAALSARPAPPRIIPETVCENLEVHASTPGVAPQTHIATARPF
jgi:hypothetical protein